MNKANKSFIARCTVENQKKVHKVKFKSKEDELQAERNRKSKMLREYAKLCAREGVVSDRVHIGSTINDHYDDKKIKSLRKKRPKETGESNHIIKKMKEEQVPYKESPHNQVKNAPKPKMLKQRFTKSGQPKMKSKILGYLEKIKSMQT